LLGDLVLGAVSVPGGTTGMRRLDTGDDYGDIMLDVEPFSG